ncbi:hypothetical protein TNCV_637761 [Trichonephila clavipes]|nr:hypothetical protein TNCV_637761 [Trichonephila clavipes]
MRNLPSLHKSGKTNGSSLPAPFHPPNQHHDNMIASWAEERSGDTTLLASYLCKSWMIAQFRLVNLPIFLLGVLSTPDPGTSINGSYWPCFSDNAETDIICVAMNSLVACKIRPWPARSQDLSTIEHAWDIMRRLLHLPGSLDDFTDNWRKIGKIYRRRPSGCLITLFHIVWQLCKELEFDQRLIDLFTL